MTTAIAPETQTFKGFTRVQLNDAFTKVENKQHWKGPIAAIIMPEDFDVTAAAIEFYTGTKMSSTALPANDRFVITAPGYWAGPCN